MCVFAACSDAEWSVLIDPYGVGLIHTELYLLREDDSSVRLIWRHYSPETSSYKSLLPPRQYTINGSLNTHTLKHTHTVCMWADLCTSKQKQIKKSLVYPHTNTRKLLPLLLSIFPTDVHLSFCFSLSLFLSPPSLFHCIDWPIKAESSHNVLSSTSWTHQMSQEQKSSQQPISCHHRERLGGAVDYGQCSLWGNLMLCSDYWRQSSWTQVIFNGRPTHIKLFSVLQCRVFCYCFTISSPFLSPHCSCFVSLCYLTFFIYHDTNKTNAAWQRVAAIVGVPGMWHF